MGMILNKKGLECPTFPKFKLWKMSENNKEFKIMPNENI